MNNEIESKQPEEEMDSISYVELLIRSDELDLDAVTQTLGINPTKKMKKREKLHASVDHWCYSTSPENAWSLDVAFEHIRTKFENKASELLGIKKKYDAVISIEVVIEFGTQTVAIVIDEKFINFVHSINAYIDMDTYLIK